MLVTTPARSAGFTLIELLVTLVIAVSAGAVILAHLRTMGDMSIRLHSRQEEAADLLNRAAEFSWRGIHQARATLREGYVELSLPGETRPLAWVRNFDPGARGETPIDQAYTPFQLYQLQPRERFTLALILGGLSPPVGN